MTRINVLFIILFLAFRAEAQSFNNRFSVQGYLKTGTTALDDAVGFPVKFLVKRNSTVVWCQTSASNLPVLEGVFTTVLSGNSNCQSLTNALSNTVFEHAFNSDTFVIDIVVDVNKDGFGGADDATFAGVDLLPVPLAISANEAQTAQYLSGLLGIANGGTGATTAAAARTNLGLGNVCVLNTSGTATDVLLGDGTFGDAPVPVDFSGSLLGDVTGTQSVTTVGKIQGHAVQAAMPANGQVLMWNTSNSRWEPTTPAAAPVTSVAGKTGVVTIDSVDISDATSAATASKLVLRDASANFSANSVQVNSITSSSALSLTPGTASGTVTIGNTSTGATNIGNTGAAATVTLRSPVINVGLTGTATTTTVGTTTGASATTIQAGTGKVKIGSTGNGITSMGGCTIASTTISTTATNYTCTGIPASTSVAVHCSAAAALTSSGTNGIFCRSTGVANQVSCNTMVVNSVATTYPCMWLQP